MIGSGTMPLQPPPPGYLQPPDRDLRDLTGTFRNAVFPWPESKMSFLRFIIFRNEKKIQFPSVCIECSPSPMPPH